MIPFGMRQVTGGIRYGIWDWRLSVSEITEPVSRLANNDRAAVETRRSIPDEMRAFNFAVFANNNLGASDWTGARANGSIKGMKAMKKIVLNAMNAMGSPHGNQTPW